MPHPGGTSIDWYDRKGKKIKTYKEVEKKLGDPKYRIIKRTELKNGYWVSTVWIGLGDLFSKGPPLIFQTKVFFAGTVFQAAEKRSATEKEALAYHKELVAKWGAKPQSRRPKEADLIPGAPGYKRASTKRKKGKNANLKA